MSRARTPEGIEIAALRKKTAEFFDPMAPGGGTPWEDRGSHGTVGAFFKTCMLSLKQPLTLLFSIRRPETTHESTGFVIGCGLFWGASWFIHSMLLVPYFKRQAYTTVDMQTYVIGSVIQFAIGTAAVFFLLKIYNSLYSKMVSGETMGRVPPALIFNVNAYCLGPSILAIIPVLGPPLALVWIAVLLAIAGFKRLKVSMSGSIIATVVSLGCIAAIAAAAYFAGMFGWYQIANGGGIEVNLPKKPGDF